MYVLMDVRMSVRLSACVHAWLIVWQEKYLHTGIFTVICARLPSFPFSWPPRTAVSMDINGPFVIVGPCCIFRRSVVDLVSLQHLPGQRSVQQLTFQGGKGCVDGGMNEWVGGMNMSELMAGYWLQCRPKHWNHEVLYQHLPYRTAGPTRI